MGIEIGGHRWGLKRRGDSIELDPELQAERREGISLQDWNSLPDSPTADERVLYGPVRKVQVLRNDPVTGFARPVWEFEPIEAQEMSVDVARVIESFLLHGVTVPVGALVERSSQIYLDNADKFD